MKLVEDFDRFKVLQEFLIREIISDLRVKLVDAGVAKGDTLKELTGTMAFNIAAIVDGCRNMSLDGEQVLPVLTFARTNDFEELICEKVGSFMHEIVFDCLDDVFES